MIRSTSESLLGMTLATNLVIVYQHNLLAFFLIQDIAGTQNWVFPINQPHRYYTLVDMQEEHKAILLCICFSSKLLSQKSRVRPNIW